MKSFELKVGEFGKSFANRKTAADMVQRVSVTPDCDNTILDFHGVEDATPSFLDELLTRLLKNSGMVVVEEPNESIFFQLQKVLKTMSADDRSRISVRRD